MASVPIRLIQRNGKVINLDAEKFQWKIGRSIAAIPIPVLGERFGADLNAVATELCTRLKTGLQQGDFISGTMIVLGYALCREEDTDCPDYIIEMVETMRVVTNKQTKGETNV